MYGVFTYIWLIFMVNVGKYTIHGWYGIYDVGSLFGIFIYICHKNDGWKMNCPFEMATFTPKRSMGLVYLPTFS